MRAGLADDLTRCRSYRSRNELPQALPPHVMAVALTVKVIPRDHWPSRCRCRRYHLVTSGAHIARTSGAGPTNTLAMSRHQQNVAMHACAPCTHRRKSRALGEIMKSETIAVHCGYEPETTTKAVAVPIYQTVAYAFDCGAWCGAVQSRGRGLSLRPHQQPHDRRAGAPRRRAGRRRRGAVRQHRPGCAELCFAQRHRTRLQHRVGAATLRNHHTLFAHVFPRQGVSVRFAAGISRPTSRS